jgi:hypothetical protein
MAVRTQKDEVLEPVVEPVPVDVMKRHRQRLTEPGVDATALATVLLEPLGEQPLLEMRPVRAASTLTR